MIDSIKSLLNIQTANPKDEPTKITEEETNLESTEEELVLVSSKTFPKYKKNTLLEVVEFLENGNVLVQNEGDETDRWEITKEVFNSTYEKFEEEIVIVEPVHVCKNKCDSCEFDYAERSCV